MDNLQICEFVTKKFDGKVRIESNDKNEFLKQYRLALEETRGVVGVVYVLRTENPITRLKGCSNIL